MGSFFSKLIANVRFADLLDIVLVAAVLYAVLLWLRESTSQSASRRTLLAITGVALVYGLALLLELYLVKTLIEVLLVVLLLGAVVVFQSDIRRMADRIATWGPFRRTRQAPPSAAALTLLTEAAARMAETRTGALIALRGREPWDRYIEGGIELEGKVSLPLLYSIFNPDSPGHDGVVLMEGDQVKKFGAHLPLSSNLPEASQFGGTRHAAALGLSEHSDALVVVVSEERGTISVAEHGMLEEISSVGELSARLSQFWERHYTPRSETHVQWWYAWYGRSWQTGLLSLALASLLWLLFAYSPETVYRNYTVPVELRNLKPGWSIEDDVPSEARVTLIGSEQAYRLLDATALAISLDISTIMPGENEFVITEDNLELPSHLRLYNVSPQIITVQAQPQLTQTLPIEVQLSGELADSLELVSIRSEPEMITVLLPTTLRRPPPWIQTQPIDLREVRSSMRVRRRLLPAEDVRLPSKQHSEVLVDIQVRPRIVASPAEIPAEIPVEDPEG